MIGYIIGGILLAFLLFLVFLAVIFDKGMNDDKR